METQGVTLEGNDRETLEAFLTRQLKAIPPENQRFVIGAYDLILSRDPESNAVMAVFYPKTDTIEHVYIIERPR